MKTPNAPDVTEQPTSPARVGCSELVVLPAVKQSTTGDEETDRLFAEAVSVALERVKPALVEILKQEVFKRVDAA